MAVMTANRRDETLMDHVAQFYDDPLGFVHYIFPWGEGPLAGEDGPEAWQADILAEIGRATLTSRESVRVAVASGHGIGKTALVSWIILWFISTRAHPQIVVTANTQTQLTTKTWRELAKWHRLAIHAHWFEWTATKFYFIPHPETWFASAIPWTRERSEAFAGTHEENVLIIYDEASLIDDVIWEVTEGAMTERGAFWLAFGNPTRNQGRFFDCFHRFRARWITRQIDSRSVTRTNKDQINQWIEDYGLDSDFVKVRILGQFPSASDHQFIPREYVEEARARQYHITKYQWAPKIITLDNAWTGSDETVIGMRQGLVFSILATFPKNDNDMVIAGHLARLEDEHQADAVFIDFGYGTGVYSAGKQLGRDWIIVPFGEASPDPQYANLRMYMWAQMKEWLRDGGAIPDDRVLCDDLIGPEAHVIATGKNAGKLLLESKDDMKKRGLPSPNRADALALSFARPVRKEGWRGRERARQQAKIEYDVLNYSMGGKDGRQ